MQNPRNLKLYTVYSWCKALVFSKFFGKRDNSYDTIFKKESVKILKILGSIDNIIE